MRLIVAGAGAFGREHIRLLSQSADVDLVGIADLNEAAARQAADDYGVAEIATDASELTDRLRPDGLIVATPGPTHVAIATRALALGIPVLVEKPVAMTLADARSLARAAGSGFVLPGHVLRFSSAHQRFVEIARSNDVGAILSVTARRHRNDAHARRYVEDPVLMTMVHDIDLAIWLTEGDTGAANVLASRRPRGTSRSETLATVELGSGAVWRLATAWTFPVDSCPADRIEVVGENGSVELDVNGSISVYGRNPRHIDVAVDYDEALRTEHAHFIDCIDKGRPPTTVTLDDAIAGLTITDAILASLQTGEVTRS